MLNADVYGFTDIPYSLTFEAVWRERADLEQAAVTLAAVSGIAIEDCRAMIIDVATVTMLPWRGVAGKLIYDCARGYCELYPWWVPGESAGRLGGRS